MGRDSLLWKKVWADGGTGLVVMSTIPQEEKGWEGLGQTYSVLKALAQIALGIRVNTQVRFGPPCYA